MKVLGRTMIIMAVQCHNGMRLGVNLLMGERDNLSSTEAVYIKSWSTTNQVNKVMLVQVKVKVCNNQHTFNGKLSHEVRILNSPLQIIN